MFTPLSKGSERAQDNQWDHTVSPRKPRTRTTLSQTPVTQPTTPRAANAARAPEGRSTAPLGGPVRRQSTRQRAARRISMAEADEGEQNWTRWFIRPKRKTVDKWLSSFWMRHTVLTVLPCVVVWVWVAIPFPVSDPYKDNPFPDIPVPSWPRKPSGDNSTVSDGERDSLPLDVNFYFFLFWMYLAVALFFITNLFSLYRLNWWPSALGGKLSYGLSWGVTLLIGLWTHHLDLFNLRRRWESRDPANDVDWERKTFWVVLSFVAMLMPAIACFSKLKRDKRHTLRNNVPSVAMTFFGDAFSRKIPASWRRFLWFMTCLGIACFSLIAGQAYASLYLSTLPHTSLDAGTWVYSWVITVQLLSAVSMFILSGKVRSRALLFLYKLFFQLVYHVFYRNLFARLRSPSQFATVQLLSSFSVLVFPLQMTRQWHRLLQLLIGYPQSWEDHVEGIATSFFCRSLAQNVTMVGFLGWLSILHFGPNSREYHPSLMLSVRPESTLQLTAPRPDIYPFFRFSPTPEDPYTFPLTFTASIAIWGSELVSSFIARGIMMLWFKVDVTQVGLGEMKEYPELAWASVHVSMNILLFLIKLNFR